jgi:hypothetical protein
MIDPHADWPWPTFAELRDILVNKIGCHIDPPPPNLIYSTTPVTVFVRTGENGDKYDWIAFHQDKDRLTRRMVMNACRNLHIMLEALNLRGADPVP